MTAPDIGPGMPKLDSTLSKGLAILEQLAAAQNPMGVSELSRAMGLTKSNTFRLLQTLTALGYVAHRADKRYEATLKTWQVGRAVVNNTNLRELAAPDMRFLSSETGETVYLAVPQGLEVIYLDKIESRKPIRSWNPVGGSAPIHCVGTGKAILASNYATLRDRAVATGLSRFTDRTITDAAGLDRDVAATLDRGYAVDSGEFRDRILSVGGAITLPGGRAIGALGISVPDVNLEEGDIERIGGLVAQAARNVSQRLGRG